MMVVMMEEKASAQVILKRIVCGLITVCGLMLAVLITIIVNVRTMTAWISVTMATRGG
jgi:hypothetical protein